MHPLFAGMNKQVRRLDVNGEAVKLDWLGPVVLTEDGQMRYIANWSEMSEAEQEATRRVIGECCSDTLPVVHMSKGSADAVV